LSPTHNGALPPWDGDELVAQPLIKEIISINMKNISR